jgi:catechol 2,3-dioxygenase-like lactoylglutathione lyase family enzyme
MSNDVSPLAIEIGWVCVDCKDPEALAGWWQALIGGEIRVDDDGDVHLDGGPVPLLFLRVPDQRQVKNRLHFDLHVEDYEAASAKALSLGASPADDIFVGERWRVFRDPEGNEFCIIRPKVPAE